jgi:hypothetical protein
MENRENKTGIKQGLGNYGSGIAFQGKLCLEVGFFLATIEPGRARNMQ